MRCWLRGAMTRNEMVARDIEEDSSWRETANGDDRIMTVGEGLGRVSGPFEGEASDVVVVQLY